MKFKRRRLSADHRLVNAGLALVLSLALAACGSEGSGAGDAATPEPQEPAATPENELPAVWSTVALDGPVRDIAMSGGGAPLLAVAYERIGLQFFNLSAERIADSAPYSVRAIADGRTVTIQDAEVILFPGVGEDGGLRAYVFGDGLLAPVELTLPVETRTPVIGLCAGDAAEGLFSLAYWTMDAPETLITGVVSEVDQEFAWSEGAAINGTSPIGSCGFTGNAPQIAGSAAVATALLERETFIARLTINEDGDLFVAENGRAASIYTVRDGITVKAPTSPTALAALGRPLSGGYPGGVIVLAGETDPGVHQAVFVDAAGLTLRGD